MINHLFVLVMTLVTYAWRGRANPRRWLLACGLISLPWSYDYSIYDLDTAVENFRGWTEGIVIRLSDVYFYILLALELARRTVNKPRLRELIGYRAFGIFVLGACLSVYSASHRNYSVAALLEVVKDFILYAYVPSLYLRDRNGLNDVLRFLAFSLIFQGGLGILQLVTQDFFTVLRTGGEGTRTYLDDLMRSEGTLGQPNSYASFLVPTSLLLFSALLHPSWGRRRLYALAITLAGFGLVFSFSRAGWLAFGCGVVFILMTAAAKGSLKVRLAPIFACLILGALLVLPLLKSRVTGDDYGSAADRYWLNKHAMEIIRHHYVTGVGINNYRFAMYQHIPDDYDWPFVYRVHNAFLLVLAEMGVTGALAMVLFFLSPIIVCFGIIRHSKGPASLLAAGLIGSYGAIIVQNLVDLTWANPALNSLFFLLLAITTSLYKARLLPKNDGMQVKTGRFPKGESLRGSSMFSNPAVFHE